MRDDFAWRLALVFAPLSLLSFGGRQSAIADVNKQVVDVQGWMSHADFVDLFAISRAAPGPGSLLSTLIGWRVDGLAGAVVASLSYFLPSSLVAYAASRLWNRYRDRPWRENVERGLAPVAIGLVLSGAFTVLMSSSGTSRVLIIAAVCAAIFALRPKLNPLPILFAAGLIQLVIGEYY